MSARSWVSGLPGEWPASWLPTVNTSLWCCRPEDALLGWGGGRGSSAWDWNAVQVNSGVAPLHFLAQKPGAQPGSKPSSDIPTPCTFTEWVEGATQSPSGFPAGGGGGRGGAGQLLRNPGAPSFLHPFFSACPICHLEQTRRFLSSYCWRTLSTCLCYLYVNLSSLSLQGCSSLLQRGEHSRA